MLRKWVVVLVAAGVLLGGLGICFAKENDSFSLGLKAQDLIGRKDYNNAVPALIEALKNDPMNTWLRGMLANCYYQTRQYKRAKQQYELIGQLEPQNDQVRFMISVLEPLAGLEEVPFSGSAAPDRKELKAYEIEQQFGNAVVFLQVADEKGEFFKTGSGFIIRETGSVVTNFHVVAGGHRVEAKLPGGSKHAVAHVIAFDQQKDLAVLQLDAPGPFPVVRMGDSSQVMLGEQAVAIGSPLGMEHTISDGLVSAWRDSGKGFKYLQISVPISAGSSGGPLFNMRGDVIGVTSAGLAAGQNLNFAVPVNFVKQVLQNPGKTLLADLPPEEAAEAQKKAVDAELVRNSDGHVVCVNRKLDFGFLLTSLTWRMNETQARDEYVLKCIAPDFQVHLNIYPAGEGLTEDQLVERNRRYLVENGFVMQQDFSAGQLCENRVFRGVFDKEIAQDQQTRQIRSAMLLMLKDNRIYFFTIWYPPEQEIKQIDSVQIIQDSFRVQSVADAFGLTDSKTDSRDLSKADQAQALALIEQGIEAEAAMRFNDAIALYKESLKFRSNSFMTERIEALEIQRANQTQAEVDFSPQPLAKTLSESVRPSQILPPLADFVQPLTVKCSPEKDIHCQGLFPPHPKDDCHLAIFDNGEDSFAARIQSLRNAKKSIRIQALIFTGDEAGYYIANLLKQKKAEGLDVRVIVDALSNMGKKQTQRMYYDLKQHGIVVEGYEVMWLQWINEISAKNPINKRMHEKLWLIDAEDSSGTAIIGGLNVANEYFRVDSTPYMRWRDQDVLVQGAIVKDMAEAFDRNFDFLKSIKQSRPDIFNTDNAVEIWLKWVERYGKLTFGYDISIDTYGQVYELANKRINLELVAAPALFVQNRPVHDETYILQLYLHMIRSAQKEILIENAYFVPRKQIRNALVDATKRGVNVTILTNSRKSIDMPRLSAISRYYYKRLMEGGSTSGRGETAIHEWFSAQEGTLHSKFSVFDRKAAIVGSYNLDPRSELHNSETVIVFVDATLAGKLAALFERDLEKSHKVTRNEAQSYEKPDNLAAIFELKTTQLLEDWLY